MDVFPSGGKILYPENADANALETAYEVLGPEGKTINFQKSLTEGIRTADALVDGVETELKRTRKIDADEKTVKNHLNKARGQARVIILDARGTKLTETSARRGVYRAMGADPERKIQKARVIGSDFDVTIPREEFEQRSK
ncbi:hypothetical protein HYR99_37225 [Candidatus Poribacteria bacterium]|nr:hypothetical protein [Candidatus Poribacteria bacterium]